MVEIVSAVDFNCLLLLFCPYWSSPIGVDDHNFNSKSHRRELANAEVL